jgi:hypothetical protein
MGRLNWNLVIDDSDVPAIEDLERRLGREGRRNV